MTSNDMPPVSGTTVPSKEVWPENPTCFFQPCNETLVVILVTQKQANENNWRDARFFCADHAKNIYVHSTAKLPSGHIVGIVKEPDWDAWDSRDSDA